MKKLLFFLIIVIVSSCSLGNDSQSSFFEILPIEHVVLPNEFIKGETYEIFMTYIRPNNCHSFNDIYYEAETNIRKVAIVSEVFDNSNCDEISLELEVSFDFKAVSTGEIVFKFWKGKDVNENDQYLEVIVPIID